MVEAEPDGQSPKFLKEAQEAVDSGFRTWGRAWYEYGPDGRAEIHCEEGSCTFHFQSGCINPEPIIEDNCLMSSSCASYKPRIIEPQDIQME